ncbi:MAG TPA: hypothetical protein VGN14_19385 [Candidatus Elarobacter sp.]|jgi:hypothetical protein
MAVQGTMWWLADAMAPLAEQFGDDLTLWRDGGVACWRFEDQTVLVAAGERGTIEARFIDRPARDEVSGSYAAAVYERIGGTSYPLTPDGGSRMAADMSAFFTGVREPKFAFVAVRELRRAA